MLPVRHQEIKHQVNNGFNSRDLEERMKAIDWSRHPGNFFDRTDNEDWLKMDQLSRDLSKFTGLNTDPNSDRFWKMNEITDALMAKYWTGTPIATAIMMTVPYHRSTFYDLYHFPPNTHASLGGNKVDNKPELEKLSKQRMDAHQFAQQLRRATKAGIPTETQQILGRNL